MMKKIIVTFITVLSAVVLNAQNFVIYLNVSGFPDGTKFRLEDPEKEVFIDSALLHNNKLQFKGRLENTPQLLFISTLSNKEYYWCNLFIGNETIYITGSRKDFPFDLNKKGSKYQDEYNVLNDQTRNYEKRRDELVKIAAPHMNDTTKNGTHIWDSVWRVIQPIDKKTDSIRLQFVKLYFDSYAGMNELYYLKTEFKKDTLQDMYDRLSREHKKSIYGQRIKNYLIVGEPLKKGDTYYNFEAIDNLNTKHKLSDFKEKYILLDFTETYCGPCMLSVAELKKVDSMYKDKLQIISFCIDKSEDVWHTGFIRDAPTWLSLWDGEGGYGKTVLKYGVTGFPTFFLISPDGKIVWKESGYGDGNIRGFLSKNIK